MQIAGHPSLVCSFICAAIASSYFYIHAFSYPSFIYLLWLRVNHTPYWVKYKKRKILEISRFNQSSWPIIDFYTSESNFQEATPIFYWDPQHRGLVILGPPRLYIIYCITVLLYFILQGSFFLVLPLYHWSKVFHTLPIGWAYYVNESYELNIDKLTFFFFFPTI